MADTAVCELFERTDMSEDERSPRSDKRSPRGVFERPKGSGVWWVCYFDENGPERIRRRDVLLADFFKDYLGRVKGRLRSYREYDRYAKRLTAAFPGRTLRQLLPGDIERYVAKRVQDVSPATVNRDLQLPCKPDCACPTRSRRRVALACECRSTERPLHLLHLDKL